MTNCAFHHGLSFGAQITNSENVLLENNDFFSFRQIGVNVATANKVHLIGNWIIGTFKRDFKRTDNFLDRESGLAVCSMNSGPCNELKIQDNVCAGASIIGCMHLPGDPCEGTPKNIVKNNVAHSSLGAGIVVYPDPSDSTQKQCFKV